MKMVLLLTLLFVSHHLIGQMTMQDIEDKDILHEIKFLKSKTDGFLMNYFHRNIVRKFQFEFLNCGYFDGELRYLYPSLNSDKPASQNFTSLVHNYSFHDKKINLETDLDIWVYRDKGIKIGCRATSDSLKLKALEKIYTTGMINRITAKIFELKLRRPATLIQVNETTNEFDIFLKDESMPHKYFIN